MKQYSKHIRLLFMMVLTVFTLSSCHDDEDDASGRGVADGLQTISYMSMNDAWSVKIEEGESVDVAFKVIPAAYASLIALQPIEMLTFVPFSPTNASMEITNITATEDGILTVSLTPKATVNGQFYLFALMVRYEDRTVTSDNIKFWREFVPDNTPKVQLKKEQVSQTLAV